MEGFISARNVFNAGDLITMLPGFQHLYQKTGKKTILYQQIDFPAHYYDGAYSPIRNSEGQQVCMNEQMFSRLRPLLESQPYIERFQKWEGQTVDFDMDRTRDSRFIPLPGGLIHYWTFDVFPELACNLSKAWLHVTERSVIKERYAEKILINRTHRYNNPYISYYFLKEYQDRLLFSGTDEEHKTFCSQFNLDIEYLKTDDFLQLAQIIAWCKGGVFGQSLHFHISDALKKHRILELCAPFPNTFPTGENGYAFYHQATLEYFFDKLLNK